MSKLNELVETDTTRKNLILYFVLLVVFVVIGAVVPDDPTNFGIISVLPAAFLIVFIFRTKRIIEALTLATFLTTIMAYKTDFFSNFNEIIISNLMSEDMSWLIIVCGLMGGIVAVIETNGGGYAFGEWVVKKAKTKRSTMLWTIFCSALLSVDDYMNVLVTGSAMTPINDRHKNPREMTAYIIDSTAAPACVLNPISTWSIFIGGLMIANGLGEPGKQVLTYIRTIPYNFYAMAALLVLFLVVMGVIPIFGPMKKAFERVEAGGPIAPPGSEKIDIRAGKEMVIPENPRLRNFFVPMAVLVTSTILFGFDMQMGVITTICFNFIWFVAQGMDPSEYVDEVMRGLKNMLMPLFLVVLAFSFADGCARVGFIDFVVGIATKSITLKFLPITVFIIFAITEFIMGISWGMYIIALPMVIPITTTLGGDVFLMTGAVAAAGVWGSHCCFYSDATILTSAASGCDNFRHAITQIPYGLMAGFIAMLGYLLIGFILY